MAGLCKALIIGRLGRDSEVRFTPQGKPVLSFNLAADSGWGDNKQTVWFRVSMWGERAQKLSDMLRKGQQVYVEGNLRTREWDGNDGVRHTDLEVTASEIVLLGGKRESDQGGQDVVDEDSIPF